MLPHHLIPSLQARLLRQQQAWAAAGGRHGAHVPESLACAQAPTASPPPCTAALKCHDRNAGACGPAAMLLCTLPPPPAAAAWCRCRLSIPVPPTRSSASCCRDKRKKKTGKKPGVGEAKTEKRTERNEEKKSRRMERAAQVRQ